MHPPPLHPPNTPANWPECFLEAHCPACGRVTIAALRMLLRSHGRVPLLALADRLCCQQCGAKAAPVYLNASQYRVQTGGGGPSPDWAVELVAVHRPTPAPSR